MTEPSLTAEQFLESRYPVIYKAMTDPLGRGEETHKIHHWAKLLGDLRAIPSLVPNNQKEAFIADLINTIPPETNAGEYHYAQCIYDEANVLHVNGAALVEEMMRNGLVTKIAIGAPFKGYITDTSGGLGDEGNPLKYKSYITGNVFTGLMRGLSDGETHYSPLPFLRFLTDRPNGYESVLKRFYPADSPYTLPDPNFQNHKGETPLHFAIFSGPGKDMASQYQAKDKFGDEYYKNWIQHVAELTVATCAVKGAELLPEATRMLLDYGADPTIRDEDGKTVIQRARWLVDEVLPAARPLAKNPEEFGKHLDFIAGQTEEMIRIIERHMDSRQDPGLPGGGNKKNGRGR